ncbi:MAG TPA: polymer-forming cytoskeletal protein [Thermoanaerobaculia bacterium]|nr:polymer-forming cytoskeletal protein [Thermoanaerobaculia bacterium]
MKIKPEGTTLNGFLDKGSQLQGELAFEETFRIDGKFDGKIRSGSELILGDTAEVSGEIEVGRLSVNGKLKGTVRAKERVELHARARVEADLTTPILKIEEGALFEGSCRMGEEARSNVVDLSTTTRGSVTS